MVRTQRFFFSVHLVNQCVCLQCFRFSPSTSVNKHISGTGAFRLSVRSSVSLMRVHPALMHAKLRIASRWRYVPVFLLGNKWQLMIFMGRSGPPAPSVSAHIRVSNSMDSHFIFYFFAGPGQFTWGLSGRVLGPRVRASPESLRCGP